MTDYKDRVSGWPTDIDWSKAPENAKGVIVTKTCNVHHPKIVFASGHHLTGCMIRATAAEDGSPMSAQTDCWDWVDRPAPQWSGEGLPPVGTVCDVTPHNTIWGFSVVDTYSCTVLAYHEDFAWLDIGTPVIPVTTHIDKVDFAPIKTQAQIAAEEREAAIGRMKECFDSVSDDLCPTSNQYLETLFGALHDAGLRFPKGDGK